MQPHMGQMPMGHPAAQSQQYPPHMGQPQPHMGHPPLAQQQLSPTQLSPPAQQAPAQPTTAWGASSPEEHRWPLPSESADAGAMNHGAAPSQARQEVRTAYAILVRFALHCRSSLTKRGAANRTRAAWAPGPLRGKPRHLAAALHTRSQRHLTRCAGLLDWAWGLARPRRPLAPSRRCGLTRAHGPRIARGPRRRSRSQKASAVVLAWM